jgi:hypothetical protein
MPKQPDMASNTIEKDILKDTSKIPPKPPKQNKIPPAPKARIP